MAPQRERSLVADKQRLAVGAPPPLAPLTTPSPPLPPSPLSPPHPSLPPQKACPPTTRFFFVTATIPEKCLDDLVADFPGLTPAVGRGLHRPAPGAVVVVVDCSGGDPSEHNAETAFRRKSEVRGVDCEWVEWEWRRSGGLEAKGGLLLSPYSHCPPPLLH